jgi:hypothetical protein
MIVVAGKNQDASWNIMNYIKEQAISFCDLEKCTGRYLKKSIFILLRNGNRTRRHHISHRYILLVIHMVRDPSYI